MNAKCFKYFSKEILVLVKLQDKDLLLLHRYLKYFTKEFCIFYFTFSPHLYNFGLRGPKQYIFGDQKAQVLYIISLSC